MELTSEELVKRGLERTMADKVLPGVNQLLSSLPPSVCWQKISREILTKDHPFQLHKFIFQTVFHDWDVKKGPPPAWLPRDDYIQRTNIAKLMKTVKITSYKELHKWSVRNRSEFWDLMVRMLDIRFKKDFIKILDLSHGAEFPQWFVDAKLNITDSCFNAPADAKAIIFQTENGALSNITYKELNSMINRVSNALVNIGFNQGDAIAIDMPMTVESVAIYLGIIRASCVVVSIADSFAPDEIKIRLHLANTKAIFTQDYLQHNGKQLPLYKKVTAAGAPKAIVLPCKGQFHNHPQLSIKLRAGDLSWEQFLSDNDKFNSISRNPSDYMNILFSSGTTGEPKAVPWTHTTPVKCATDGHLHHNIQPGDVVAWPTNLGWMMGPWLIYASLINKATIALYYGSPKGRAFGQFVQDAGVTMLGVVPSLVKIWKNTDCMKGLNWQSIKTFSSTGECSNPEYMLFLMFLAGYKPIIEYCGGTELGGGYITQTVVQPAAPAKCSTPALGLDFILLDEDGHHSNKGEVFLVPPSIGLSTELLNMDHHKVYFEGTPKISDLSLRRHGDQIERLEGGYYRIHGRVDDTMNLGGIKVSSAEIEQTLSSVSGIQETAAVAVFPPDGGPCKLVIYAVLCPGTPIDKEVLVNSMQKVIKEHLNPIFKISDVVIVDSLPRTASNKVMRRMLREKYNTEHIYLKES
jgi:acetyl-CoA synthetase